MSRTDKRFIRRVIKLARKGVDRPSSSPLVGAVVVARDEVIGESFAGKLGSEAPLIAALDAAGEASRGASVYTNMEPREGSPERDRTIARLINARPSRLVIGESDAGAAAPSRLVERLKQEGINVDFGVGANECHQLNERFLKFSRTGLPFVTVKFAQSLDGRIATSTGDSQWISSSGSLRFAHQLRREHDSVMVGIGTVLRDDPQLTVRLVNGRNPLKIVIDSRLRIPLNAKCLEKQADTDAGALVVTTESADPGSIREVKSLGVEVLILPRSPAGGVSLEDLLRVLGERGIASVLVEGGAGIITSFLADRLVDRLVIAVAPKLIGSGIEAIGNLEITRLSDAIGFGSVKTRRLGPDLIFDARLAWSHEAKVSQIQRERAGVACDLVPGISPGRDS